MESNEVTAETNNKRIRQYTERRFRDVEETAEMLRYGLLNFSESINPITLQTMQAVVGDPALQFRFIGLGEDGKPVVYKLPLDIDAGILSIPEATLQHMTVGRENTLTYVDPANPPEYRTWTIQALDAFNVDAYPAETSFYVYARVPKEGDSGTYRLSDWRRDDPESSGALPFDDGSHYNLLIAVINSAYAGSRSIVPMYGFTEILPGMVVTEEIRSADGENYFDLRNNSLKLTNGLTGINEQTLSWLNGLLSATNMSIKDSLKVIGEAYIAGLLFSNQKIESSAKVGTSPAMILDGINSFLQFNSKITRWTESGGTETKNQYIRLSSGNETSVEVRNTTDGDVSYMSSQGIFANRAGVQALPLSSGIELKAAVVALGQGNLKKEAYGGTGAVCGVYGTASNSNSDPAPAYGGFFNILKANGLVLNMKRVIESTNQFTQLTKTQNFFISASSVQQTVYLPSDAYEGSIVYLKQWWTGITRIYPSTGQKLYDDSTENSYIDLTQGQAAVCVYIGELILNSVKIKVWLLNKIGI